MRHLDYLSSHFPLQPQRPRAWRVRDENLPPTDLPQTKTIHQRNKSTPALSSLLQVGGNKMPAKRSAFADVSNTVRVRSNNPAKDDLILPAKATHDVLSVKPNLNAIKENASSLVAVPELSKPSALLRPAQRPVSSIIPKSAITSASLADLVSTMGPRVDEAEQYVAVPKPTRNLSKRHTMVFSEKIDLGGALAASKMISSTRPDASFPSEHPTLSSTAVDTSLKLEKSAFIDQEGVALPLDDLPRAEPKTQPSDSSSVKELNAFKATEYAQDFVFPMPRTYPELDSEEYWDEDEEEEYFDADGYTTARSIRSRGDTTGVMTIIMEPRVTARVERELAAAKQFVESTRQPEDVEDEAWDTSMVAEYGDEIFTYMKDLENRMKPNPHYMDAQTEIQWSMRAVLMDWLVQVHHRFTLLPETLFLSVNYVDRFLSCKVVSLGKLQLVGATAIFVAAKYEEINCPSVQEIIFMVDGGYTMDEILKAERFMLTMLQFELGWPGPMSFLRRISKADDYDLETRTLAKYFLEVTVMDERFVAAAPSFTAAGAHCLARLMLKKGDWGLAHIHYSGYTYKQIFSLVQTILECCEEPRKHHAAVYDKYSDKRYKRASLYVETEVQKGFRLPQPSRESIGSSHTFRRK
ncbi:hypothetical protein NA57DRAFT_32881 [Rhizodiscina lignyota]|uniref:Cyclin N-terminal domain-containing protein n=1 Tax=Rhizodiscina lignyota TaxID=1504668 RepID=A0A9P4M9H7_9PEZI|nr:hypothetical protein NA57DRAFT_32881 [Rhizodiscina lignyota]